MRRFLVSVGMLLFLVGLISTATAQTVLTEHTAIALVKSEFPGIARRINPHFTPQVHINKDEAVVVFEIRPDDRSCSGSEKCKPQMVVNHLALFRLENTKVLEAVEVERTASSVYVTDLITSTRSQWNIDGNQLPLLPQLPPPTVVDSKGNPRDITAMVENQCQYCTHWATGGGYWTTSSSVMWVEGAACSYVGSVNPGAGLGCYITVLVTQYVPEYTYCDQVMWGDCYIP